MKKQNKKYWWVYLIECRNKSLYTGITTDVNRRFEEHQKNNKKASKYCVKLRPLKLVYSSLPFNNRREASKEEYRIKQLNHKQKKNFIKMRYEWSKKNTFWYMGI